MDSADIVVGIATYNNASTVSHVVKAVDAGLKKYFPRQRCIIINSDGGSTDGTPDVVRGATLDSKTLFFSPEGAEGVAPSPIERISAPYRGIPGKGSAFKAIFEEVSSLGAKACCVVDADLRSITPEWIELLLVPVIKEGYGFIAPLYSRHKNDGTITNSLVYPMTRALYGRRVRQPIGGDFGFSGALAEHYLSQDVWETDVARFGIDIWMTTEAITGGFDLCQSYLGAKIHDPKDPGADLTDMFLQVVGSLLTLTERHYEHWRPVTSTTEVPTFGFKYYAGPEPVRVNVEMMIERFRSGVEEMREHWESFIVADIMHVLEGISRKKRPYFVFPDETWVRVIYEFALAFHHRKLSTENIARYLIPLYMGRTASFSIRVAELNDDQAEEAIEEVCVEFERQKQYLAGLW